MSHLQELGRFVAAESDAQAAPSSVLFQVRCRVFGTPPRVARRRIPIGTWALGIAAAAAAALVLVFTPQLRHDERTIGYQVEGGFEEQASFVETSAKQAVIRFDEGSRVTVLPETGMRVLETKPHGVSLSVERGRVRCLVNKGRGTQWTVRAGPFDIRVTGTQFETEWKPEPGRFELSLLEGSVEVLGPGIDGAQRVTAGEQLVVNVKDGAKMLTGRNTHQGELEKEASPAPSVTATPCVGNPPEAPVPRNAVDAPIGSPKAEGPSWEKLAASGKYREAAAQIRAQGWDVVLRGTDVTKIRLLADTLRMGGSSESARRVLLEARNRYGEGNETAFLLGKIAADQSSSPAEALRWFERYLQEEPNGALREQALGRCLDLEQHVGAPRVWRRAKAYLVSYPKGVYAPLAEKILESEQASPK